MGNDPHSASRITLYYSQPGGHRLIITASQKMCPQSQPHDYMHSQWWLEAGGKNQPLF